MCATRACTRTHIVLKCIIEKEGCYDYDFLSSMTLHYTMLSRKKCDISHLKYVDEDTEAVSTEQLNHHKFVLEFFHMICKCKYKLLYVSYLFSSDMQVVNVP